MFQLNQFMAMMRQGYRPEQLMINALEQQMGGTPLGDNLIKLAQQGNGAEIEKIARNLATQQGVDFDKEFSAFRKSIGF